MGAEKLSGLYLRSLSLLVCWTSRWWSWRSLDQSRHARQAVPRFVWSCCPTGLPSFNPIILDQIQIHGHNEFHIAKARTVGQIFIDARYLHIALVVDAHHLTDWVSIAKESFGYWFWQDNGVRIFSTDSGAPLSNFIESMSITCGSQYIPVLLNFYRPPLRFVRSSRWIAAYLKSLPKLLPISSAITAGFDTYCFTPLYGLCCHLRQTVVVFMVAVIG